jgi:hypothetical protein
MSTTLPRATGIEPIAITPRLWNQLCDMVESAAKFAAAGDADIFDLGAGGRIVVPRATNKNIIPLLVTQIGGVAGTDQSAVCTYTYDIFDAVKDPTKLSKLNTASSGAALSLQGKGNGWRSLKLQLTAATRGMVYKASDGTWKLFWLDEAPANEKDCT